MSKIVITINVHDEEDMANLLYGYLDHIERHADEDGSYYKGSEGHLTVSREKLQPVSTDAGDI